MNVIHIGRSKHQIRAHVLNPNEAQHQMINQYIENLKDVPDELVKYVIHERVALFQSVIDHATNQITELSLEEKRRSEISTNRGPHDID